MVSAHLVNYTREYFTTMLKTSIELCIHSSRITHIEDVKKTSSEEEFDPQLVYGNG